MAALTGLTAIAGFQVNYNPDPQATPEQRMGNTVDPRHSVVGEQAQPYSWESKAMQMASSHGPYGTQNQLLGDEEDFWEVAGDWTQNPNIDLTPTSAAIVRGSHAAPFPSGILSGPIPGATPDDIAAQLRQSAAIHGVQGLNASAQILHQTNAQQAQWSELWNVTPGHSDLVQLPRQAISTGFLWGTRDRTQSMARQNEFGFDAAHAHRRYATRGPAELTPAVPGNYYWLRPGGRPMSKTLAGPARPAVGPDSPFYGDDLGASFSTDGAILQNVPPQYVPPPQPNLGAPLSNAQPDAVVEWY